ncbi:hypothetical protein [Psychroflexus tropicus]|uniref:hypothetical protein n=1 Tax=Psychroflexus tropicus TaxID=197345 RepID=UPI00037A2EC0|nr:hypothetical protein [Psychroflexus tropicus]
MMKNWLIYILIALINLQSFGINPSNSVGLIILVDHYDHHKVEHDTNFLEFLDLHYGGQREAHEDKHQEHDQLPFHENQLCSHTFFFETPEILQFKIGTVVDVVQHNFSYHSKFGLLRITEILHPPKHGVLI